MKYRLSGLILFGLLLTMPAMAETVSCTSSDGVLHIADNLMSLPSQCRNQARPFGLTDPGRVNFVPKLKVPPQNANSFGQAVAEEVQTQRQHQQQAANLTQRAKSFSSDYLDAVVMRKSALRHKKYGYRKKVQRADKIIQQSRAQKTTLLKELKTTRLSKEQYQQIESLLDKID